MAYPFFFFFFNDTATTEIYTLSLHDALPISSVWSAASRGRAARTPQVRVGRGLVDHGLGLVHDHLIRPVEVGLEAADRKSTRLNSSHANISYAVFCLKKKKIYGNSLHYII